MRRRSKRAGLPGQIRLIGGAWRSRRLAIPDGAAVRPTPDRVRETVFNWLGPALAGARCLDLFAGTGALGFEALSRGAARAVLVERDARLAAALHEHARALGTDAEIRHERAERFLSRARGGAVADGRTAFDIVFVDPPYTERVEPIAAALEPWLADGALVYFERAAADGLPDLPGFEWRRQSRAGDVAYGIAARRADGGREDEARVDEAGPPA